jgi:excisionase family DNA binding protein
MVELKSGSDGKGGGGRGLAHPRPTNMNKLCYTVPEAAQLLGFSRNFGYELARTGKIPILRFGKRMLVPKAAFDKMLGVSPGNEAEK